MSPFWLHFPSWFPAWRAAEEAKSVSCWQRGAIWAPLPKIYILEGTARCLDVTQDASVHWILEVQRLWGMETISCHSCQWWRIKCIPGSSSQTLLLAKATSGWESHCCYPISAGLLTWAPVGVLPRGRPGFPSIHPSSQPRQGVSSVQSLISIEMQPFPGGSELPCL